MKRPQIKSTDLVIVLLMVAGILMYWVQIDPVGYLLYSSLIVMTLLTAYRQLTDKNYEFRYPKILLICITLLVVLTGIDRMTLQLMNSSIFPICFILYILIQPKPAWITRP